VIPGDKPVMALVKVPIPVPSVVFVVSAIVGLAAVPQQTPRTVMGDPPSEVTFPPLVAVVDVMAVAAVVVTEDRIAGEVKVI